MTDRERVARALLARVATGTAWEDVSGATREHFLWLADAAIDAVSEHLSDPVTVHANMLAGRIARPTLDQIRHLYPELAQTWRRIPDEVREGEEPRLWRHKKRGTVYAEVGLASLQVATERPREGDALVIYRGDDGKLWARARIEFEDGRFEPIPPLPAPPAGEVGVVAIGYANTATGGVEVDNAGIIRRAPGAGEVG